MPTFKLLEINEKFNFDLKFMSPLDRIRHYENAHIALWLVKDTCWMMEIRWLGAIMVLPTLAMAIYIVVRTFKNPDVFLNLAVLCWITANSYWMIVEFFFKNNHKHLAVIPFAFGFLFVGIFYYRAFKASRQLPNK